MKHDIQNRADLEVLLAEFYAALLANPEISWIFTDVARIDLSTHLTHIVDFWEFSLFHTGSYRNNVMQLHLDLDDKTALKAEHFQIWLDTFYETTDVLFSGQNTERLKTRALSIAQIMQVKLHEKRSQN